MVFQRFGWFVVYVAVGCMTPASKVYIDAFSASSSFSSSTPATARTLRRTQYIGNRSTGNRGSRADDRVASTTQLFASSSSSELLPSQTEKDEFDLDAITKYVGAGMVQMTCFYLLFTAFDLGTKQLGTDASAIPLWCNALFFWGCSLRSRLFNPLRNARPTVDDVIVATEDADGTTVEIVRPAWTPPGIFFPIMWVLVIGALRAYSSAVVVDTAGHYTTSATLAFVFHLTVGDIWNTINNVEQRLGAATTGVVLVIMSAGNAAYQYLQVSAVAGQLLGVTLLWLCTAGVLVAQIRQLNPRGEDKGRTLDPFYPVKGTTRTEFSWFTTTSGAEDN